ncbi:hypothetical protein BJL95_16060 [Methylomonas sp. LWB]|uniref:hypothetical protein n=1 Tax=Methylomonas sp. LWB TaxID=1905845 RepID=UPI0008DA9A15|nr:hypothetical protein [Methylomonas sp. LWB]OHX35727.1 hypothetical protein BJL95_16060 [Methylomonas sp. LWB]
MGDVQTIRVGCCSASGVETLTDQAIYVYDDVGCFIEQTDALGHTSRRKFPNGPFVEWNIGVGSLLGKAACSIGDLTLAKRT